MADQTLAIDASPRTEARSTVLQIAVLALLAATGTLATNILLPSLPQMAVSLKVSTAAVTSAITVFLAVFAVGQLVVGPVSDRFGRRWPVLIGFAVFFAGSVWCGLATALPGLLAGRVVQVHRAAAGDHEDVADAAGDERVHQPVSEPHGPGQNHSSKRSSADCSEIRTESSTKRGCRCACSTTKSSSGRFRSS